MKEEKKDWIASSPAHVVKKGDNYIFTVSEQAINDENFLAILKNLTFRLKSSSGALFVLKSRRDLSIGFQR